MKLARTVQHNPALFTLAPFVNVLFLVVIFFALSSRFVLQSGVAVTLPFSSFTLAPQRNAQIVSIVPGPEPALYFHDQKFRPDELAKTLKALHAKDRTIIVRADRATPYDLIVNVTNQALEAGYAVVLAATPPRP